MNTQHPRRPTRVHLPIERAGPAGDRPIERILASHPGVIDASVAKTGLLLIVDYDPAAIDLAELATIMRAAGHPIAPTAR